MEMEGGTYQLSQQLQEGSRLVYTCPRGLYPHPAWTHLCLANGSWTPAVTTFPRQQCRGALRPGPGQDLLPIRLNEDGFSLRYSGGMPRPHAAIWDRVACSGELLCGRCDQVSVPLGTLALARLSETGVFGQREVERQDSRLQPRQ